MLFDPDIPDWSPVAPIDLPTGVIGFDLETKDNSLASANGAPGWPTGDGYVVGVAIAWDGGKGYYPVAHAMGGNLDEDKILDWLLHQMRRPDLIFAVANGLYDFGWLYAWCQQRQRQFVYPEGRVVDVQVQAPLLDEYRPSYSLDNLGRDYLGRRKSETGLYLYAERFGIKRNKVKESLWKLPAAVVAEYAQDDAELTRLLADKLGRLVVNERLEAPCALEHDLQPVLLDMRRRGIRLDVTKAKRLAETYRDRERDALALIRHKTGFRVDAWGAESIAPALIAEGIEPPRHASGAPSVTKALLTAWAEAGSVTAKGVLDARKWSKARGTHLEGVLLGQAQDCGGGEWRIFPEFHPLRAERDDGAAYGTVSYRFSSNLQQLPGRDGELTRDIRGCLLPEHGEQWIAADFSQQEPKLGIHYAEGAERAGMVIYDRWGNERTVRGGVAAAEAVRTDPKWDFHNFASRITGVERKKVKSISLGRMYGSGVGGIAEQMGMPWEWAEGNGRRYKKACPEVEAMVAEYDEGMPWVKDMADLLTQTATQRGTITLLGGYKARFSAGGGRKGDFPHKAFNRLCQGSGAAQTKRAMVDAYRAGIPLLVTMHDELGASGQEGQRVALAECMSGSFADKLRVPFRVDAVMGADWGEAALL